MKANKTSVLTRTFPFLSIVSKLKPASRRKIFKELNGNKQIYKSFREIAINTLNGKVKLTPCVKRKLKPYNKCLQNLCKHKTSKTNCKKRNCLIQKGNGAFAILAPLLAPYAIKLMSNLFNKNE